MTIEQKTIWILGEKVKKLKLNEKKRRNKTDSKTINDKNMWNQEIGQMKKMVVGVLQEIKMLESFHCMEVKSKINFYDEVQNFEINLIKTALIHSNGSQRRSAQLLNLTASALNNKIKRYRISLANPLSKVELDN